MILILNDLHSSDFLFQKIIQIFISYFLQLAKDIPLKYPKISKFKVLLELFGKLLPCVFKNKY